MSLLRLTESGSASAAVEIALEADGRRRVANVELDFSLSDADREDIRWYLEDYLEYPIDPAPKIAAEVESRLAEIGCDLFTTLFDRNRDAAAIWSEVSNALGRTRIEIVSSVAGASSIPWELLREPATGSFLALRAQTFARANPGAASNPRRPEPATEAIRIMLVICRPAGDRDVPFRSVASRLIRLSPRARSVLELEVLRPPTFAQLVRKLIAARDQNRPYHVVHFDGHGVHMDREALERGLNGGLFTTLSPPRDGSHGYLVFEDPKDRSNRQLVDGPNLATALGDAMVPVAVMNACRSAHAELFTEPSSTPIVDAHERVRAYGSLAHELSDGGVGGVVAMRYNVYVVTAASFVAELYGELASGSELGQAVSAARRALANEPLREVVLEPRPLQDWTVPVVYESIPLSLIEKSSQEQPLRITLSGRPASRVELAKVAPEPDVGFFGRDETLLAVDRAFDGHNIVLLHAWAGAGKTVTAGEFARWYSLTRGIAESNVLATSFTQKKALPRVLDQLASLFANEIRDAGYDWAARPPDEQRDIALDVLRQRSVLWIWDNIEPIAGFPAGTPSLWTADEQNDLSQFLREARATSAKFLLTSRRPEHEWLQNLPRRVELPPMPMLERIELARALARRYGHDVLDVADWRPLLRFSQGNPLTLTALVTQALRDRIHTAAAIQEFVANLRIGTAEISDDEEQGRAKSLAVSLNYGFEHSFTSRERAQLALLHLFRGFVDADVLHVMGHLPGTSVPALEGIDREGVIRVLDRAAETGTLTARGGGYYDIHPAVPWHFQALFREHHGSDDSDEARQAVRAYVIATGVVGEAWHDTLAESWPKQLPMLMAEEANLLRARELAIREQDWPAVLGTMQGLLALRTRTGWADWRQLVEELAPSLLDMASGAAREGLEAEAATVRGYLIALAIEARDWERADAWGRIQLEYARGMLADLESEDASDDVSRSRVHNLVTAMLRQAKALRTRRPDEAETLLLEAYSLSEGLQTTTQATLAQALAEFYIRAQSVDLDQAEHWIRRTIELRGTGDPVGRARGLSMLGTVYLQRARKSKDANEAVVHLRAAHEEYAKALELLPAEVHAERAILHNQLGNLWQYIDVRGAITHYETAVRLHLQSGNERAAAECRFNAALALEDSRPDRAMLFATAARDGFRQLGRAGAADLERTKTLIGRLNHARAEADQGGT